MITAENEHYVQEVEFLKKKSEEERKRHEVIIE